MKSNFNNDEKHIYLETLGCEKNRVDSEIMLAALKKHGFQLVMKPEEAEVIVINTCAFLTSASQESIDRILALSDHKAEGQCEKLVATGCLSQRYQGGLLDEIPELDGLLGSSDFFRIPFLITQLYENPQHPQILINKKPHYSQYEKQEKLQSTAKHFAYLKIAEGCSNMCSFCNIPSLRGGFSSRSVSMIIEEMQVMVENGVKEINLLSQDTSSYGKDLAGNVHLATLLRAISEVEGDFWIRLFYAYPNTFPEEALEIMSDDPRFCRYLDMPFQHINDSVLQKMNRKITQKKIREKMTQVRKYMPDLAWRSTFIVGFPTESEENFEELHQFVAEGHFDHLGVFTYSDEDNIRSAKWGDPIPNTLKRERKSRLLELQQKISLSKNETYLGKTLKVLVDGVSEESDLLLQGRSQYQGPNVDGLVYINEGNAVPQQFNEVEITDAHPYDLVGRLVSPREMEKSEYSLPSAKF
ncbi:MAG: 30S ribosomal protein S12 methylthiotransferase RimO [SAR324 cluster bacterium]|nr:30S ribosomal protein S12 methylthiotransferase RimO [SAR324 cluster bacterium]